jgi:hypothetical protein
VISFESETVAVHTALITNSIAVIGFMIEVIPTSEPETWLQKQQLILGGKPTVAALLLFADEPRLTVEALGGRLAAYRQAVRRTQPALALVHARCSGGTMAGRHSKMEDDVTRTELSLLKLGIAQLSPRTADNPTYSSWHECC